MPRGEANGRTWIKVHADIGRSRKFKSAGGFSRADLTFSYTELVCFSRRELTDGIVRDEDAIEVVAHALDNTPAIARNALAILRANKALKRRKGAWIIPDYPEWQQTREAATALAERQSEKGKASARKRTAGSTAGQPPVNQPVNREEKRRYIHNVDVGEGRSVARDRAERDVVNDKNREEQEEQPLPARLLRILPDRINVRDLRPKQRQLLLDAHTTDPEAVRHLMAGVERADSPIGLLMTGCKQIAGSLDVPTGPPTEQRAQAFAERMTGSGMEAVDIYAEITKTWPDLTPEAKESIIRHATNPETEAE